jgi:hypothetical protein
MYYRQPHTHGVGALQWYGLAWLLTCPSNNKYHSIIIVISISCSIPYLTAYRTSFLNYVSRGITPGSTRQHRLHSWSQGRSNLRSQWPCHTKVEFRLPHTTPRHTVPRGVRLNAPEYIIWYVLEFHFTFTILCNPILRLAHTTPNEFWAVRNYTWHKVALSG